MHGFTSGRAGVGRDLRHLGDHRLVPQGL